MAAEILQIPRCQNSRILCGTRTQMATASGSFWPAKFCSNFKSWRKKTVQACPQSGNELVLVVAIHRANDSMIGYNIVVYINIVYYIYSWTKAWMMNSSHLIFPEFDHSETISNMHKPAVLVGRIRLLLWWREVLGDESLKMEGLWMNSNTWGYKRRSTHLPTVQQWRLF